MASGPIVKEVGANDPREKQRYTQVYTRKAFKGAQNHIINNTDASIKTAPAQVAATTTTTTNDGSSNITEKNDNNTNLNSNNVDTSSTQPLPPTIMSGNGDLTQLELISTIDSTSDFDNVADVATVPTKRDLPVGNASVKMDSESRSKQEIWEIRGKLQSELEIVRSLVKQIEEKQGQFGGYGILNISAKWVQSEVASRPLHQLENSRSFNENSEKEKRTPKVNQFYCNSEFLLAKDKLPLAVSNKKSKLNSGKLQEGEGQNGFGTGSKFFKSCSSLLEKLMKHKHGWVFNSPVDVEGLGLHDYFSIIKHPMDFGNVKSKLNKNWYKSPKEFAEDVRLTFHNALIYNPKGQDVHIMAEELLGVFEDRWAIIELDYDHEIRLGLRKAPPLQPPPIDTRRILERTELRTNPSRTPAPKKPKAKDINKREMSYEEKQKLSNSLQALPSERLDAIIEIIKKRNSALLQQDGEVEVDIDSMDIETLWELDRYVTNYKKSLSKYKRKAELVRAGAEAAVRGKTQTPLVDEVPKEKKEGESVVSPQFPVQGERQGDDRSRSSSSSSDSGSSSSGSDGDSSSASGSDSESPRT